MASSVSWVSSSVSGDTSHFDRDVVGLGSWPAVSFVSGEVAHHVSHHGHTADCNAKSCSGSPSLVENRRLSRVPWWTTKSLFFLVLPRTQTCHSTTGLVSATPPSKRLHGHWHLCSHFFRRFGSPSLLEGRQSIQVSRLKSGILRLLVEQRKSRILTAICAVALVRGLSFTLLESSRVENRVVAGTTVFLCRWTRQTTFGPFLVASVGTSRQRTVSAKKEVCFMSGATAAVVVNRRSQEMFLSHFGATVFYDACSPSCKFYSGQRCRRTAQSKPATGTAAPL